MTRAGTHRFSDFSGQSPPIAIFLRLMVLALRFVRFLHGMKCFWMLLDFTGKYTNESLDAASMVRILQRHSKSIMWHYGKCCAFCPICPQSDKEKREEVWLRNWMAHTEFVNSNFVQQYTGMRSDRSNQNVARSPLGTVGSVLSPESSSSLENSTMASQLSARTRLCYSAVRVSNCNAVEWFFLLPEGPKIKPNDAKIVLCIQKSSGHVNLARKHSMLKSLCLPLVIYDLVCTKFESGRQCT